MKVLIVEDNADNREFLRYNFEIHGCEVIEASDGREGLELAKIQKPGLIVSDALMPVMDGFQFLRIIKTDENLKSIPFIFYSAVYTGYKEEEFAVSIGADAFIIKPKEPEEFWKEIQNILEDCKVNKKTTLAAELIEEEKKEEYLQKYSAIVATKLEEKVIELEKAITEQKRKEEELMRLNESLREAELKFQSLAQIANDAIILSDNSGAIVYWNTGAERIFGYKTEEVLGKPLAILMPERYREAHRGGMERVRSTGQSKYFGRLMEFHGIRKDGSEFPIELSITFWPTREETFFMGILRDLTERRRAEEMIREQLFFLQTLIDTMPCPIFYKDVEGRYLGSNNAFELVLGRSKDGIVGKTVYDVAPKDLADIYHEADLSVFRKPGIQQYETAVQYADGSRHEVFFIKTTFTDLHGKVAGLVGVMIDITERKKLEDQLRQSQKMEAIGQIAAGISHDFNNILTAIIGFASILKMKMRHDDPLRINLDQILTSADRAAYLTQSLLAFSRKQINNPVSVNLNEIIIKVEKLLLRVIGENIEFKSTLSEEDLTIMADTAQLEQVLINLAANARDAMPDGGVLSISTESVQLDKDYIAVHGYGEPGLYALITITDTGIGMDKKTIERICEPFFTTKEVGKGTGLGLSIVYGIIKQHSGYFNCYSELGKGTTFRIYLPRIKAGEDSEIKTEETVAAEIDGTETILIAEDEETVRMLARQIFEEFGYTVLEAANGEEAIEKFKENRDKIQLLFFDIIMPRMSGLEAYEKIRHISPDIKILFTSGYPDEFICENKIFVQGLDFISKPVQPATLLRKVREVLDKK